MAAAIVPEGHAINDLLPVIATEVANSIDFSSGVLGPAERPAAREPPRRTGAATVAQWVPRVAAKW